MLLVFVVYKTVYKYVTHSVKVAISHWFATNQWGSTISQVSFLSFLFFLPSNSIFARFLAGRERETSSFSFFSACLLAAQRFLGFTHNCSVSCYHPIVIIFTTRKERLNSISRHELIVSWRLDQQSWMQHPGATSVKLLENSGILCCAAFNTLTEHSAFS